LIGPENVSKVITHVTSSQKPWQRYVVGYDAFLFSYPLSCLPNCVGDFVAILLLKMLYSPIAK
jgi:hypothetical protein